MTAKDTLFLFPLSSHFYCYYSMNGFVCVCVCVNFQLTHQFDLSIFLFTYILLSYKLILDCLSHAFRHSTTHKWNFRTEAIKNNRYLNNGCYYLYSLNGVRIGCGSIIFLLPTRYVFNETLFTPSPKSITNKVRFEWDTAQLEYGSHRFD